MTSTSDTAFAEYNERLAALLEPTQDALFTLSETFHTGRRTIPPAMVATYAGTLARVNADPRDLPPAVDHLVDTHDKYFPKPADLRKAVLHVRAQRMDRIGGQGQAHGMDTTERCPQCFTAYEPRGTLGRLFCDCQWALHAPHEDANAAARQTSAIADARRHRVGGFTPLGDVIADVLPGVPLPAELRPPEPAPVLATTSSEPPAWDGPQPWERDDA